MVYSTTKSSQATGFGGVWSSATANSATDTAYFYGSAGDDYYYYGYQGYEFMLGTGYFNEIDGYDVTEAIVNRGRHHYWRCGRRSGPSASVGQ